MVSIDLTKNAITNLCASENPKRKRQKKSARYYLKAIEYPEWRRVEPASFFHAINVHPPFLSMNKLTWTDNGLDGRPFFYR